MNFSFLIVTLPFNIDIFLFMTKRSTHSWYKFFSCILKSLWLIYANKQFGKCPSVLSNFYIMDGPNSFIGCKLDNRNNNKNIEG